MTEYRTDAVATLTDGRNVRIDTEQETTYQSGRRAGETTLYRVREAQTGRWIKADDVHYISR